MLLNDLSLEEVTLLCERMGEKKFRAKQLFSWLNKGVDFDGMANLPKSFTQKLKDEGYIAQAITVAESITSELDGTIKYLYRLNDGNIIEGVLMKYKYGNTLCVSTQVGCRMNCSFCASGLDGLIRNLSAGEILGQVIAVNRLNITENQRGVTNVVLMGSGEPLDNYDNVTKFLNLLSSPDGLNFSKRNVSLSTCGLCDKIYRLADEGFTPTLTVSLHAGNDERRKLIMPIANKYSIKDIMQACRYYFEKTGRRIIFEYTLINGKNDTQLEAKELAEVVKGLPCHINLIRLNPVKERGLNGADNTSVSNFMKMLESKGVSVTLRRSMGSDIDGACGQLRRRYIEKSEDIDN